MRRRLSASLTVTMERNYRRRKRAGKAQARTGNEPSQTLILTILRSLHQFFQQCRRTLPHCAGCRGRAATTAADASAASTGHTHGDVERRATELVLDIELGAVIGQETDQRVATRNGNVQRRFAVVVHEVG